MLRQSKSGRSQCWGQSSARSPSVEADLDGVLGEPLAALDAVRDEHRIRVGRVDGRALVLAAPDQREQRDPREAHDPISHLHPALLIRRAGPAVFLRGKTRIREYTDEWSPRLKSGWHTW
jgi:hypothetical protein